MNCCALTAGAERRELSRIAAWMRASTCLAQNRSVGPGGADRSGATTRQPEHRSLRLEAGNCRAQLKYRPGADRSRQLLESHRAEDPHVSAGGYDERLVPGIRGGLVRPSLQPVVRTEGRPAHERRGKVAALGGHPACTGDRKLDGHGSARARERGHEIAPIGARK